MDNSTATLSAWGYGLACGGYAGLAVYLLYLGRSWKIADRTLAIFAAVALSSVWGGFGLAFSATGSRTLLHATGLSDILRYAGWYVFLLLIQSNPSQIADRASGVHGLRTFAAILIGVGVLSHVAAAFGFEHLQSFSRLTLLHSLATVVVALILLEQLFRNVAADSSWNVKPLCLGLASAFVFDLYLYSDALLFNQLDSDAFSIRGLVHALIIPLLVLSTTRSRDWTSKIRLSQKAVFHSATLLIAGVYLLFMAGVGYYVRYFGGDWGRALQLALLFAALLVLGVLVFSGSMRAKLRVLIGKHFFSYRYDYREEWLRFTAMLSPQDTQQAMGQQVIRGLADLLESPAGGLWLKDSSQHSFSQTARWNLVAIVEREDEDSSLCRFLADSGRVVNLEELRCFPRRYSGLELPTWLSEMPKAWLIVPLVAGTEMIGFVVLASARTDMEVNWEVHDLLRTAGRQAASFLAQMRATEALLEARKFDAFNRMSAFVVHDLKNIVTQLSLMLRNAERHRNNPEFQQDMLMTVENSVERMRQLMLQLREGAAPSGTRAGVDLTTIIRRVQAAKESQGRKVEVQLVDEAMATRGDEERIDRVIGHLVQNALDATDPERGRVWVRLAKQGGQAMIEVGDTGHGMSDEFVRDRLFKPFQTTKQAGMGIGAYESHQYVQELGGKMSVDSEVGVGTRVKMLLPLFDVGPGSDLREKDAA